MEQPIQYTDKELELLIIEKLKSIIQQQEAINLLESQQLIINKQQGLNIIADSVIKDLDKTIEEIKTNTSTPTPLTDFDITLISKKLLVDLTSSKNCNKKETIQQKAERIINNQFLNDAIKKHK